jgi:4'-phosphopantetheinyl transferase
MFYPRLMKRKTGHAITMSHATVSIILRTLPLNPDNLPAAAKAAWCLSAAEHERAARFVFERDRLAYTAAHGLLRRMLTEFHQLPPLAWQFSNNAYGRPQLDPEHHGINPPRFNLSHTRGRVAVALTRDPVPDGFELGVDAEGVERTTDALGLAKRFLSPRESDWLHGLPATEHHTGFLRLWTLKEAVAKAAGLGLSLNFQTFHCDPDSLSVRFDDACWGTPEYWHLHNEWIEPGHWVSMAIRCPPDITVQWQIEHLSA